MPSKKKPKVDHTDVPNPDAPEETEPDYFDDFPDTLAPPSHSTQIDLAKEFEGLDRAFLIAMVVSLRARVAELEAGGIILKGWWCLYCDTFNGEEKEVRLDCRHCGRDKKAKGEAVRLLGNTRNEP
jgi:hypothetical protein